MQQPSLIEAQRSENWRERQPPYTVRQGMTNSVQLEQLSEQGRPAPVTMRDVARRAGVSLATVSYVLNEGPRPVSGVLRQRVVAAMRDLGYRPARRGRARARPLTV